VRGFRLDRSRTERLLSSLTGGPPSGDCPRQPAFAEVIVRRGTGVNVELGGCYQVDGTRTADPAVVEAILGRG